MMSGSPGLLLPSAGMEPSPTTGIHLLNGLHSAVPPLFVGQGAMLQAPLAPPVGHAQAQEAMDGRNTETASAGGTELPRRYGVPKLIGEKAHNDGFSWRKYGEKVVKGSPNPRSYYKCSHAACSAKKIVERNEYNEVLATDYKGDHNHAAPLLKGASRFKPPKGRALPPPEAPAPETAPGAASSSGISAAQVLAAVEQQQLIATTALGRLALAALPGMLALPGGRPGVAAAAVNNADEDDEATEESDEQQQQSKRSAPPAGAAGNKDGKLEANVPSAAAASKDALIGGGAAARLSALMEAASSAEKELTSSSPSSGPSAKRLKMELPTTTAKSDRISQPEEEVGNIDDDDTLHAGSRQRIVSIENIADGFKWRKYGQKTVKGSPHPRSYYKCTYPFCPVRKHVEKRQGDDDKWTVTYEGQHTHAPPNPALTRRSPRTIEALPEDDGMECGVGGAATKEESSQPSSPGRPHVPSLGLLGSGMPGIPPLSALQQVTQFMQQAASLNLLTGMPLGPLGNLSGGLGGLPLPLPLDMGEALAQVQANSLQLGALAGMMPGEGGAGGPSLDALNTLNLQLMAATQLARHTNQLHQLELMLPGQGLNAGGGWDPMDCLATPRMPAGASPGQAGKQAGNSDHSGLERSRKRKPEEAEAVAAQ